MVHNPISFHGNKPSIFIRSQFQPGKERRPLSSIGNELFIIIFQVNRSLCRDAGRANQRFDGGAKLVTKSAAGSVLNHPNIRGIYTQTIRDH